MHHRKKNVRNVSVSKDHSEKVQPKRMLTSLSVSFVPFVPLPACLSAAPIVNPNQPTATVSVGDSLGPRVATTFAMGKNVQKKRTLLLPGSMSIQRCRLVGCTPLPLPPTVHPFPSSQASSPLCSNCFLPPSTSCCPNRRRRRR